MKSKGFSLMEMMVVLLIVAIIAAASAPMVSKNLSRSAGNGDSPWVFTGTSNSVAYNMNGDTNSSAIIGATKVPDGVTKPKLYIESKSGEPQLGFGRNGRSEVISFTFDTEDQKVGFTNANPLPKQGVFIGTNQAGNASIQQVSIGTNTTGNLQSVVVGNGATATGGNAVAIGSNDATASSNGTVIKKTTADIAGVAVGSGAEATGNGIGRATAVGYYAKATHSNSTAIGAGATSTAANQIVLGTNNETVRIPGNLLVEGNIAIAGGGIYINIPGTRSYDGRSGYRCISNLTKTYNADRWIAGFSSRDPLTNLPGWITSDRRLKNVGEAYTAGLAELNKLDFYHYTFKKDETKTPQVGVMAQDLQKVFPDAVKKGDDGFLRIRWDDMFYAVINAVKELDAKVKAMVEDITTIKATLKPVAEDVTTLKDTVKVQQQAIEELQKQNAALEARLAKLEKSKK